MNLTVVFRELWQSWRASLRRPGFVLLAGFTLALGLGLSVAMSAMVDTLVLAPPPFERPGRLVDIGDGAQMFLRARWFEALQGLPALHSVAYWTSPAEANLAVEGQRPESVVVTGVSGNYLPTLGVHLALGRNFTANELARDGPRAVILTYGFWRQHYAGQRDVLGKTLQLDGRNYTIAGVLPERWRWIAPFDLLVPANLQDSIQRNRDFSVFARLADGDSPQQAGIEVQVRLQHWLVAHGGGQDDHRVFVTRPMAEDWRMGLASIFAVLIFCTSMVLLLAAVNITNLMLQRAILRGHVHAIRNALGASLFRMALSMLAEGVLVAAIGLAMALGIAWIALAWANATLMRPEWFAFVPGITLTPGVFVLGAAIGLLVMLLASMVALWRARSRHAVRELVGGGRSGPSVAASRFSRGLVLLQAALGTMLLMVALLFARAEQAHAQAQLGIQSDRVIGTTIAPSHALYPDARAIQALVTQTLNRLHAVPGVKQAGMFITSPLGSAWTMRLQSDAPRPILVNYQMVAGEALQSLGVSLRQGRWLDAGDGTGAAPVALVNESFVRHRLHGNALGQQVTIDLHDYGLPDQIVTVVGVVADIRTYGPGYPAPPSIYVPVSQVPPQLLPLIVYRLHFEASVVGAPAGYVRAMRDAIHGAAPMLAARARPLADRVRSYFAPWRVLSEILGALAVTALLLASLGLYAVISVDTQARIREWGVRGALGASPAQLLAAVLRKGLLQTALGTGAGLALGWGVSHVMQHVLAGTVGQISTANVANAAFALVAVLVAGVVASLAPELMAARTPPATALSED